MAGDLTAPLVVLGDAMLDIDLIASSARLSPEAPVPVLHDPVEHRRPGGAALAALLAAEGSRPVVLIAPVADDDAGHQLRRLLAGRLELVELPWAGSTPVKTRLRVADHPVARLDRGGDPGAIGPLPERVRTVLRSAAAVLVADYGRGVTADEAVREQLAGLRCPVVWDPHPRGADPVPGATLVTPNLAELGGLTGLEAGAPLAAVRRAAQQLARQWQAGSVCVTLGARGAMFCLADNAPHLVAPAVVGTGDTCGAGDCFAAAAAAGLANGVLPSEAVALGVAAAGRFVAAGAAAGFRLAPVDRSEPAAPAGLDALLERVRRQGGVVVATGG
ncbi:MAG: bifunctional hydroxymethylpyrimidine kinase/phosphomethylpyrimidine kinase, partial [Actinobacteria bacterium]|nr:bifunctional hydroxymethylpyrimidine kinase/phosphomethylpyrimidine kinase [Actinomycetota bacterium]